MALLLGLCAIAIVSEALAIHLEDRRTISGWDWCYVVAIAFLEPWEALVVASAPVLAGFVMRPYRKVALVCNLASTCGPVAVGSGLFGAAAIEQGNSLAFLALVSALTAWVLASQLTTATVLFAVLEGRRLDAQARMLKPVATSFVLQGLFAIALCAVYLRYGLELVGLTSVAVFAFAYMQRLAVVARDRARAHANLSWGILSGLIRTMDVRDKRTARHCAAVARFARDMAAADGMSQAEQELAHTSGLLHDIGKFALSDRVMDGSIDLTGEDWRAVRQHPAIGADLLKDIGLYGPVNEIILAHHERWDGRGYPHRVDGPDIPPIARILAVAEVYDTLTAPDTYRTPMTSFEALHELRRAAGSQLDPHYVEMLATVLAGRPTGYRHAEDADFDLELDLQRRINEAAIT